MAKTKISELEQKYSVDRKELIDFLTEKGYDVKTAGSSVDEAGEALVAERFGSKASSQPKKDKPVAVKTVKKVIASGAAPTQAAPVKKKKIIIVTNNGGSGAKPANNYASGYSSPSGTAGRGSQGTKPAGTRRPAQAQQGAAAKGGRTEAQAAYHPIKPKVVPTQMQVDYHKPAPQPVRPVRPEAEKPAETQPAAAAPELEVQAQTVSAAPAGEVTAAPVANETVQEQARTETAAEAKAPAVETAPAAETATKAAAEAAAEPVKEAPAKAEPSDKKSDEAEKKPAEQKTERAPRAGEAGARRPAREGSRDNRESQGGARSSADRGGRAQGSADRSGRAQGDRTGAGAGSRPAREGQGGARGADRSGRAQGERSGVRSGFGAQGDRSGGRFSKDSAAGGAPARGGRKVQPGKAGFGGEEASRNADAKRRMNNPKDKRNKKDAAFVGEEQRERKNPNRAGRFIKPVVEKKEPEEQIKVISIPEKLTIRDLAEKMHMQPAEIIKKLFLAGKIMTVNSEVSYEEAENIAADYEILCEKEEKVDVIEELLKEEDEKEEDMVTRAPVVCVMGHVDHGKTSLLDYIRKTNVTGKEAGGITQAIGAYTVNLDGRMITFLDTPGHEAFTAMRMRGANSTDIAVLVVAADDGVMPQTVEAINHAKAAGVEVIVAINKIDKPDANIDTVRTQLTQYGLIASDWGGSTEFVPVSAKTGEGIDTLLETILLTADVMELKANPNRKARGLVLEAKLDKGRGPVANVLVQKGTLHVGDFISAGAASGKVRALINDRGERVKEAGPSVPVMVLGLSDVPSAGEVILAHDDDKTAKSYAETYRIQHKEELLEENRMSMNAEDLFDQMREGKIKQLDLIVKADVQGSVEALCTSLLKLSNEEVMVKIIHSAAGAITESDVSLASASNAAIIGFNVAPDAMAKSTAEHNGVSIHLYKVIYEAIDAVEAALNGMLAPVYEEKIIGHAEVRQIFKSGRIGNIAGSMVLDGIMQRGCMIRIRRGEEQIYEGELASLKRFKDDVKEVRSGFECGLVFKDFDAMNVGDIAEGYIMVEVPREQVKKN